MTFAEWLEHLYAQRFTGKIELDFLNGLPRNWAPPGERVPFDVVGIDKGKKVVEAVSV